MPTIERLTVTMPADMAALIKAAVEEGDYASTSEVIREALRDWKVKRSLKLGELEALRADIDKGMADLSAGRVTDFDMDKIIERGRKLLAGRFLRLTDAAEADLAEIWAYLAVEVSEATATLQLARIYDQMKQLCRHPGIGAPQNSSPRGCAWDSRAPTPSITSPVPPSWP